MDKIKNRSVLVLVLVLVVCFGIGNVFWNSPVQSEDAHMAAGLSHWTFSTFDLYRVNPPLVRLLGTMPISFCGENAYSYNDGFSHPHLRTEFETGTGYLNANTTTASRSIIVARITCLACSVFCFVLCCYALSTYLAITRVVIVLSLFWFNPYVMGHSVTIMPDAHAAVFALASICTVWHWIKDSTYYNALVAGVVFGLAQLAKYTLLVFYPLLALFCFFYCIKSRDIFISLRYMLQLGVIFFVSILVINMGYVFEGTGKQLRDFQFQSTLFTGCKTLDAVPSGGGNRFDGSGNVFATVLGYLPMPLPANFIQGIDTQRLDFERGLPSYLRGKWSDHGWWYFYLYSLLLKMPVGTILLFLLAIFCTLFLKGYNLTWQDELLMFLPGIVLLVFVSSQSGFSIHSRYVIPALPFFFIWMSKVGLAFSGTSQEKQNKQVQTDQEQDVCPIVRYPQGYKTVRVLTILFVIWSVLSSLSVYPHSISYFNELAVIIPTPKTDDHPQIPPINKPTNLYSWYKAIISAGPRNGPRHLLDSNIDWGQDLFNLERWCKSHDEVKNLKVAYWGSYPIEMTTIPNNGLPPVKPEPGWYAISVNNIYSKEGCWRYFLDFTPVTMIGYSIYVYHLTQEDIDRVKDSFVASDKNVSIKHDEARP